LTFSGSSDGQTFNSTESFNVVYRSATTDKVTTTDYIAVAGSNVNETDTAWILKNGTTIAVDMSVGGQNINETGSSANSLVVSALGGFYEEVFFGDNPTAVTNDSQLFHSTGTSTVTIGGSQVTVTTYAANLSNEVVNNCGSTSVYGTFSMSIGTPIGATFPLVTGLVEDASTSVSGNTTSVNIALHVTAFTVA
jgi:hypothetical protein